MKFLHLLLVLLSLSVASGCAGSGRRTAHHAKLSKAMEKASDDYSGRRRIHTESHQHPDERPLFRDNAPYHAHPEAAGSQSPNAVPVAPPSAGEGRQPSVFGLSVGYGLIKGEDIYQVNHFDISAGGYLDAHQRMEAYIGLGYPLIGESADLNSSIDDIWMGTIGLRYKYFTTPRYTFLGHYFTIGVAYTALYWTYENSIQLNNETIEHDNLAGTELFVGMGLNLAQSENFQLGLEVLPGVILWNASTDRGFANDVFGDFFILKLRLALSFLK